MFINEFVPLVFCLALSNGEIELLLVDRRIARDVDWSKIVFDLNHHVALTRS